MIGESRGGRPRRPSMRALVLSDIHANLDALEAVLAAAPSHDTVWNLGDVVGYGARPNEVIDRVRNLGTLFVRGNHDRACCGQTSASDFNPIAKRAAQWTQQTLTPEHLDWLRELPAGPVRADGQQAVCVHGSPLDEDEYLLSDRDASFSFHDWPAALTFFGHTHVQGGFAANSFAASRLTANSSNGQPEESGGIELDYGGGSEAVVSEIPLDRGLRYLINPGSVGQPRDGDWRAAFALYDDQKMSVEFHRVPYDVRAAQMQILRAGLPDRLATRLREGR